MKKFLILALSLLALSACTTRLAGMTMISDRNIRTNDIKVSELPKTKNVVGESKKFIFLFIPFGTPTMKEALDDALTKADGDLMIDASLYSTSWWFLVGQVGLELRGTVVNTKEGGLK